VVWGLVQWAIQSGCNRPGRQLEGSLVCGASTNLGPGWCYSRDYSERLIGLEKGGEDSLVEDVVVAGVVLLHALGFAEGYPTKKPRQSSKRRER
jgi:hypothetical protein